MKSSCQIFVTILKPKNLDQCASYEVLYFPLFFINVQKIFGESSAQGEVKCVQVLSLAYSHFAYDGTWYTRC